MASLINIPNWNAMLQRAKDKTHLKATIFVQKRVRMVIQDAVRVSPQWSGNYANNWVIETNAVGSARYQKGLKVDPWHSLQWWDTNTSSVTSEQKKWASSYRPRAKYAGAPDAIALSKQRHEEQIMTIKWNTKIRLKNMAPVADQLDEGSVNLRRVNLIAAPAGVMTFLKNKYSYLI